MADNVTIPATGSGDATPVVATDQIGGAHYQRVKATWGADGTANDTSAANPLPVVQTGTPALPSGAATEATLDARTGSLTEAAPASDTASSGLNGRLQRIAQRLTSLIALLPSALVGGRLDTNLGGIGGTAMDTNSGTKSAGTQRVVIATDQPALTNKLLTTPDLPPGASTAAKQPALGTAGTASADVLSVQGVASMTPLTGGLKQTNVSQTPTVSTSPAYSSGDAMGGLLTFANAARVSGGSGSILGVTVLCKTPALLPVLELWLFNQTFTASTDNAAFAPSDADAANCIGVIPLAAWYDDSNNSIASWRGLHAFLLSGSASLFGQLVTRSAVTLGGTTDIVVGLQIAQD